MQGDNTVDGSRQGNGDSRVLAVRPVFLSSDHVFVYLRLEGTPHLGGGSGKLHHRSAGRDSVYMESLNCKPSSNLANFCVFGSKLRAKLLRCQPMVIRG